MAQKGLDTPTQQRDFIVLVREMETISKDLSSYFEYCQARQSLMKDLLAKSNLN
ncbi:MAG: hypothetical protein K2X66_11510 [Cyanobacteria bacterium]|nr:hypothetical protein [Cyanobacteriota bacterium]